MKKTKQLLSILLAVLLIALSVPLAFGASVVDSGYCGNNPDAEYKNVTWLLDSEGVLTISGNGEMRDAYEPWDSYFNSIDSIVVNEGVTAVSNYGFAYCDVLNKVFLPLSLKSIGDCAFENCISLADIELPDNLTTIGMSFRGSGLTSVTIPNKLQSLGSAFESCQSLEKVDLSSNITNLDMYTFLNCVSLTEVVLPNGLKRIGNSCFSGCTALKNLVLPNAVIRIDPYAFEYCSSLKTITLPQSLTVIDTGAFDYCSRLSDVYYTGTEAQWNEITINKNNDPLLNATIQYNYNPNPHIHTIGDAVIENKVAATCTRKGSYDEVTYCTECGEELFRIPHETARKPHTPASAVRENVVPASGNRAGSYDEVVYCSVCNAELSRTQVTLVPLDPPSTEPTQPAQDEYPTQNLNFFQRIIQWFRNLFARLFGR